MAKIIHRDRKTKEIKKVSLKNKARRNKALIFSLLLNVVLLVLVLT
jgi:hypothetical protein